MIVYNVQRRWFTLKASANAYRIAEGLKASAAAKIEIRDRDDLAALLNALCEPPKAGVTIAPAEVLDRAYVPAQRSIPECVPDFLLTDSERRQRALAAGQFREALADDDGILPLVSEENCPGHVASIADPKICGRCGIHIDSLRPDDDPINLQGSGPEPIVPREG